MSIQSVLVEYEDNNENKVYANSGCLISNKYVITTSNVLITLLKNQNNIKTELKHLKPGLLAPESLLNTIPEVNIVINNEHNYLYKRSKVVAIYVSEYIKQETKKFFNDWTVDEEVKAQQLKEVLSLFFIIGVDIFEQKNIFEDITFCLQELCANLQQNKFKIGDKIIVEATPFGNRHFLKTCSRGIMSNIFGTKDCFFLTDTPTAPGCEGGSVYLKLKKNKVIPIGIVLASLSWWKGEWIGLTLGATYAGIFYCILQSRPIVEIKEDLSLDPIHNVMNNSLVQIVSGAIWGSGILLDKNKGIFLTNSHVVENDFPIIYWQDMKIEARVIYKTPENEVYDIAILRGDMDILKKTNMVPVIVSQEKILLGQTVYALGFPLFPKSLKLKPTLTKGHVSQVTPNMIKTSCSVLPGASGGAILKKNGQLIGLIVCNARIGNDSIVPRVNMSIPMVNILNILQNYIRTEDVNTLHELRKQDLTLQKEWNFLKCSL